MASRIVDEALLNRAIALIITADYRERAEVIQGIVGTPKQEEEPQRPLRVVERPLERSAETLSGDPGDEATNG